MCTTLILRKMALLHGTSPIGDELLVVVTKIDIRCVLMVPGLLNQVLEVTIGVVTIIVKLRIIFVDLELELTKCSSRSVLRLKAGIIFPRVAFSSSIIIRPLHLLHFREIATLSKLFDILEETVQS